ncbi:hypothetical protein [Streptomyces sp. NPDC058434]|uniref:hypothetical protein n=1 Tax=Streptomyces sp. NPDC058434 TaxID=3346498 RepID=UPI00365D003B
MDNDTTLLFDLDGLAVARVERLEDGTRRVHLITADEQARACPECGVFAIRVKAPLCFSWSCNGAAGLRARHDCCPLSSG